MENHAAISIVIRVLSQAKPKKTHHNFRFYRKIARVSSALLIGSRSLNFSKKVISKHSGIMIVSDRALKKKNHSPHATEFLNYTEKCVIIMGFSIYKIDAIEAERKKRTHDHSVCVCAYSSVFSNENINSTRYN